MTAQKRRTGAALQEWRERRALEKAKRDDLRSRMLAEHPYTMLTPAEVAILGTTPKKLRELEASNDFIPRHEIGPGQIRFRQDELVAWLKSRATTYQYKPKSEE